MYSSLIDIKAKFCLIIFSPAVYQPITLTSSLGLALKQANNTYNKTY